MVAPTLITVEMHAGKSTDALPDSCPVSSSSSSPPRFPDATTVATPAVRRFPMTVVRAGATSSQAAACGMPPRLTLAAANA